MGLARMSDHGFVKVMFDQKTRKLVGAHIIGDEASTMVHQLIFAMHMEATADDLYNMVYIHPALPEVIMKAVGNAMGQF